MRSWPNPSIHRLWIAACFTALIGCATSGADKQDPLMARSESEAKGWKGIPQGSQDPATVAAGRRIAERECSSCHAVDRTSRSPKPGVPPLRDMLALNDPDNLAYRLIDGMRVGHDEMPRFDFDIRAADALVAYLGTISGPPDR